MAIAEKAVARAETAAARREGAAKARAKKRAPKKPDVIAKIEEVQNSGWDRKSIACIARKTGVKPRYVRKLVTKES